MSENQPHNPEGPIERIEIELTPFAREFDDPIERSFKPGI